MKPRDIKPRKKIKADLLRENQELKRRLEGKKIIKSFEFGNEIALEIEINGKKYSGCLSECN